MRGLDPRRPLPFVVLTLLAFIVARFIGVAVHEALGHGLLAILVGGAFYGVYISPVTGFALVFVPFGAPEALRALVLLGGILVEIALGVGVYLALPRVRTFLGRLFALALLEVLLVYSLAYLALGPFFAAGDPGRAVARLGLPHLAAAFLVVGLLWALVAAYVITKEVLLLVAPEASTRSQVGYVTLFWFAPLPVGALPNVVLTVLAPLALVAYLSLFVLLGLALFLAARHLSREEGVSRTPLRRPAGRIAPLAVAFLLVLPAWAFFGPTAETAQNALIAEPPLEAEQLWVGPVAINVRVHVAADLNVSLEFRFKGIPQLDSPLERRAFDSYEGRADLPFWASESRVLAIGMMNFTVWNVTTMGIDGGGTVWFNDGERPNPRTIRVELAGAEDRSRFLNVSQGSSPGGMTYVTLTVFEPFPRLPVPDEESFLDEVNLTWVSDGGGPGPLRLDRVAFDGGMPERLVGYDAATDLNFVRFRNRTAEGTPSSYTLVWELMTP